MTVCIDSTNTEDDVVLRNGDLDGEVAFRGGSEFTVLHGGEAFRGDRSLPVGRGERPPDNFVMSACWRPGALVPLDCSVIEGVREHLWRGWVLDIDRRRGSVGEDSHGGGVEAGDAGDVIKVDELEQVADTGRRLRRGRSGAGG